MTAYVSCITCECGAPLRRIPIVPEEEPVEAPIQAAEYELTCNNPRCRYRGVRWQEPRSVVEMHRAMPREQMGLALAS